MHKIKTQSITGRSLFGTSLKELIPQDHPVKAKLDKLPWDELVEISRRAYKSPHWKSKPNPRVMTGLLAWQCLCRDKTYRETADDFSLNSLCAYACGFKEIRLRTIDDSTLVKFEECLGEENLLEFKDAIEKTALDNQPPNSKGRHSGDSTVFESNISFPTDVRIMETTRLFLVKDIIRPYQKEAGQFHRIYSRVARKEYLSFAKKRSHGAGEVKEAKKKQLRFLRRNIRQAGEVLEALQKNKGRISKQGQKGLKKLKTKLAVAREIYCQQLLLLEGKKVENRIVSFHRPNIRPIFRGKTPKKTEFGLKVMLGITGRALILSSWSYQNFYDGRGFRESLESQMEKGYKVSEAIGDKGNAGISSFLKENKITDGIEKRGKRKKAPPVPKKRFARARNKTEGSIGLIKNVFIKNKLRAKTDFGDAKQILKAAIGYNIRYAL